jgi:hypothetical protein
LKKANVDSNFILLVNDNVNTAETLGVLTVDNAVIMTDILMPVYDSAQKLMALEQAFQEAADELQA